ncbi:MAG: CDP-alcohol phosphatidyltransferase family protein [Elusimicrobia bacterium]|nr:CDP-alcohol phosphatidyltransferase family protein [Elusimicrobiota bacterium]
MRADGRAPQVLISISQGSPSVAGLPCAVRAARRVCAELPSARVVIAGADEAFLRRWRAPLAECGAVVAGGDDPSALDADRPLLALAADAFPGDGALEAIVRAVNGPASRRVAGRTVAAWTDSPDAVGAGAAHPSSVHARLLAAAFPPINVGVFFDASTPSAASRAAYALYARVAKDTDGYLARFDRRLSLALTRMLLPLPVTPNQLTAAGLALSLLGAWQLAAGTPSRQLTGAFVLWLSCILDGSDGELARLKLLATPEGGAFDLWSDHVAHMATFLALPIGVARLHPNMDWWRAGTGLFFGVALSAASVWRLVLSVPERARGPHAALVERVASRDYVYLILACAALGRLDWFVWAAAVGSNLFWPALWLIARPAPPSNPDPSDAAPRSVRRETSPS